MPCDEHTRAVYLHELKWQAQPARQGKRRRQRQPQISQTAFDFAHGHPRVTRDSLMMSWRRRSYNDSRRRSKQPDAVMTSQVIDRCVADSHAPLNAPTKQELRMASLHAFVLAALLALPIGSQAANVQPDQEHARLAAMAGRWDVKQSLWEKPGEAPHIDHGTAVF